jgi:hypothetical protein
MTPKKPQISKLINFFERLIKYIIFELHLTCEIYVFERVKQNSLTF